jgi:hypothetical protein
VIVPESVGRQLPQDVAAVELTEPVDRLETDLVWRADDSSATVAAFLEVARGVFTPLPRASSPSEPTLGAGSGPLLQGVRGSPGAAFVIRRDTRSVSLQTGSIFRALARTPSLETRPEQQRAAVADEFR